MVLSALWPTHCCLCRETLLHNKLDRLPDKLQVPFGVANHDKDCYERMLVGQLQRFKFDSMSSHVIKRVETSLPLGSSQRKRSHSTVRMFSFVGLQFALMIWRSSSKNCTIGVLRASSAPFEITHKILYNQKTKNGNKSPGKNTCILRA